MNYADEDHICYGKKLQQKNKSILLSKK